MRKALLSRGPSTDQGTFGTLVLLPDEQRKLPGAMWASLELPWRQNQRGVSCIKPDTYAARLVDSVHFKRKVYRLENKNGREDCEIHPVNFAGDTSLGWRSQEHGCIGLGMSTGAMDNGDGKEQRCLMRSMPALDALIDAAGNEELEIQIAWSVGAAPADSPNPQQAGLAKPGAQGT